MYDDGYTNIVNVDYSAVCIQRMKALHAEDRPKMQCQPTSVDSNAYC